ncbi:MAG: hypothetical protein Q9226_003707 [Calogaya cf. arnoldii]
MRTSPDYRQPWRKRVLIPFWVFQSLFMIILIGLSAWLGNQLIVLIFACINMTLIVAEIILFVTHRLRPRDYLEIQVIKTTFWVVLFGFAIAGIVIQSRGDGSYKEDALYWVTGIVQVVVVLLSFIGTLIYASVIYHRQRRGTPYHRSVPKDTSTAGTDVHTGPFEHSDIGTINYSDRTSKTLHNNRDSTTAPEIDVDGDGGKKVGKGDYNGGELHELYSPNGVKEYKGRKSFERTELQGDEWVYELDSERSRRMTAAEDLGAVGR